MEKNQLDMIHEILKAEKDLSHKWVEYWQHYSHYHTWEFWFVFAMFTVPLLAVALFIDRKRAFEIGFFGYSVHVFFAYIDLFGTNNGYWIYPYKLFPFLPSNLTLDSSFVPVIYMFFYQFMLDKGKYYYVGLVGLSFAFAYLIKPLMVGIGLFRFGGKENFFLLFIGYLAIGLIAKLLTSFFMYLRKTKRFNLFKRTKE
ncbi:CBO0543 family protein [Mesobacillus foraminis]|uniref:CBO0543 family protein n=1 Tax=Mesobacillus foraminis TaxID=279826 RepID=UPI000EF47383|nr:CBO0543 family protein [Mesobacillus foraminis]